MSVVHQIPVNWGVGSGALVKIVSVSADSEKNISDTIPNATNNQNLNIAWAAGKLKSLYIKVSSAATLYVNAPSGGSPTDTISLDPDCPFCWIAESGARIPFVGTAGAVTALYLTVPDSEPDADCDLELRSAIDL